MCDNTSELFLPVPAQTFVYTPHETLVLHGQLAADILDLMDLLLMSSCMSVQQANQDHPVN